VQEGVVEGKASSSAKAGVVTSHIDMSTLGLPAQGTLAHLIMAELVQLAVGDLSAAPSAATAGRDFITSALQALAPCPVLRFSHKQVQTKNPKLCTRSENSRKRASKGVFLTV
jgi:hypothetical protein